MDSNLLLVRPDTRIASAVNTVYRALDLPISLIVAGVVRARWLKASRPGRRARGRTPLADRGRLRGTTVSDSSSTGCGMSTSIDAYLWRPRLPAQAAARLAAWSSSP